MDEWRIHILNHIGESQNSSFKSSTTAHEAPLVNYKPINSVKIANSLRSEQKAKGIIKGQGESLVMTEMVSILVGGDFNNIYKCQYLSNYDPSRLRKTFKTAVIF